MQLPFKESAPLLNLPQPIAAYLDADKAKDANTLALCFADDGVVYDEGHEYRGAEAIQAWKQEAQSKYQYVVEPLEVQVHQETLHRETVHLRALVTGEFPGSPAELAYTFTLANDKIASLEIH